MENSKDAIVNEILAAVVTGLLRHKAIGRRQYIDSHRAKQLAPVQFVKRSLDKRCLMPKCMASSVTWALGSPRYEVRDAGDVITLTSRQTQSVLTNELSSVVIGTAMLQQKDIPTWCR